MPSTPSRPRPELTMSSYKDGVGLGRGGRTPSGGRKKKGGRKRGRNYDDVDSSPNISQFFQKAL